MTEADARPPQDPAQIPPLEQRAEPSPQPEFAAGIEKQTPPQLPPSPPPTEPSMMSGMVPPQEPPAPASETGSLPPPYSPPPPRPEPPPFEPLPPGVPPQPPPPPPYSYPPPAPGAAPAPRGTGWASAAHWTSLAAFGVSGIGIGFIGPLIIWLVKKDEDPEADWHGRESLNFQLNMLIVTLVALPLICACCLGVLILTIQPFYMIILTIVASVNAADGKRFRYPWTLRLLND